MQKPGPQQGCALCRGAAEAKHQSGQECMTDGACQMDNPQYYCTMRTLGTTTTAMMIKWRRTKRQCGNSRSLEREIPPMLFCTKQSWISFKGCRTSDSRGKYSTKARKASNERSHEHMPCYLPGTTGAYARAGQPPNLSVCVQMGPNILNIQARTTAIPSNSMLSHAQSKSHRCQVRSLVQKRWILKVETSVCKSNQASCVPPGCG